MAVKRLELDHISVPMKQLKFKKPREILKIGNELVGQQTATFTTCGDMPTMITLIWKDQIKLILFGETISDIEHQIRKDEDITTTMNEKEIVDFAKDISCDFMQDFIKKERPEALILSSDCFMRSGDNTRTKWFTNWFKEQTYDEDTSKGPFNHPWAELCMDYVKHTVTTGWQAEPERDEALTFIIHKKNGNDTEIFHIIMPYDRDDEDTIFFKDTDSNIIPDKGEWINYTDTDKHGGRMVFEL